MQQHKRPLDFARGRPSSAHAAFPPTPDSNPADDLTSSRPRQRQQCLHDRPCPYVTCFYNTYLEPRRRSVDKDVPPQVVIFHPDRDPSDVPPDQSCVLDVADRGPQTLEAVAEIYGLTRERIRQIERSAIRKILRSLEKDQ